MFSKLRKVESGPNKQTMVALLAGHSLSVARLYNNEEDEPYESTTKTGQNVDQLGQKKVGQDPMISRHVDKRNGIASLTLQMQMTPIVLYTLAIAEGATRVLPLRPWTP